MLRTAKPFIVPHLADCGKEEPPCFACRNESNMFDLEHKVTKLFYPWNASHGQFLPIDLPHCLYLPKRDDNIYIYKIHKYNYIDNLWNEEITRKNFNIPISK